MKPVVVTLYVREGCTLCRSAHFLLKDLAKEFPIEIEIFDISSDPEVERKYTMEIPVIAINGEEAFVSIIEEAPLRQKLHEAIRA